MDKTTPELKETFHNIEWYGEKDSGILVVWNYTILDAESNRVCVYIYPLNDESILGRFTEKLFARISVIRPFGSSDIITRIDEVSLAQKQFESWFKGLALAMKIRNSIEDGLIKRIHPEAEWGKGYIENKEEALDILKA